MFLEILQNSEKNTCARASFLLKKRLAQVFSCEICEISKSTFFTVHLTTTSSFMTNSWHIFVYVIMKSLMSGTVKYIMKWKVQPSSGQTFNSIWVFWCVFPKISASVIQFLSFTVIKVIAYSGFCFLKNEGK